jgi:hypothetical protein
MKKKSGGGSEEANMYSIGYSVNKRIYSTKSSRSKLVFRLFGGIFTILAAPIWIFCPDNPTFRKNNPFVKEEQESQEPKKVIPPIRIPKTSHGSNEQQRQQEEEQERQRRADEAKSFAPGYVTDHVLRLKEEAKRLRELLEKSNVLRNALREICYQLQDQYDKANTKYFESKNP